MTGLMVDVSSSDLGTIRCRNYDSSVSADFFRRDLRSARNEFEG